MENTQYIELRRFQNTHWWFVGKRNIILDLYGTICSKGKSNKVLDVGCGMGLMLEPLKGKAEVYGMDFEEMAVEYCKTLFEDSYSENHVKYGSLPANIPFEDDFDTILALDVIEHIENDMDALRSLRNSLKEEGKLILTVPALMSMWSYNDVMNHHFRRYEKEELIQKVKQAGFCIELISFYNSFLFLPAYIIRKLKNFFRIQNSDVDIISKDNWINKLLCRIFSSESKVIKNGGFRIGVSLVMVASPAKQSIAI